MNTLYIYVFEGNIPSSYFYNFILTYSLAIFISVIRYGVHNAKT